MLLHICSYILKKTTLLTAWFLIIFSSFSALSQGGQHIFINPKKGMSSVLFYNDYLKEAGSGYFLVDTINKKSYSEVRFGIENGIRYFCVDNDFFSFIDNIDDISDGECVTFPSQSKKHRWAHDFDPKRNRLKIYIPDQVFYDNNFNIDSFSYGDSVAKLNYKLSINKKESKKAELSSRLDLDVNLKKVMLRMKGDTNGRNNNVNFAYMRKDIDSLQSYFKLGYDYLYNDATSDNFYGITLMSNNELRNNASGSQVDYIYGNAKVDSTVKIILGDEIIKEIRVLSGEFSVSKPLTSSNENFKVLIEGDDGSEDSFFVSNSGYSGTVPYQYNLTLGNFEDSKQAFMYFDNSKRLTNTLTLGAKYLLSRNIGLLGFSPTLNYDNFIINYKIDNVFKDDGYYGISRYNMNYNNSDLGMAFGGNVSFKAYERNIDANYSDNAYIYMIKSVYSNSSIKFDYNYAINENKKNYGAIFNTYLLSGQANLSLGARLGDDDQIFASIRIPLGSGILTSRYRRESNENIFDNDYQVRDGKNRYSFGASSKRSDVYESGRISISHYGDKAEFNARYNNFNDSNNYFSEVKGFALYDGESVYLNSDRIHTGYVLSGPKKLEVNGNPMGDDGYYVGSVSSFKEASIPIRDTSVFSQSDVYESIKLRGGGVKFIKVDKLDKHFDYVFIVKSKLGNAIESGSKIFDKNGKYLSSVKNRGVVNFTSKDESLSLIIKSGDDECKINVVNPYVDELKILNCLN
ncbi:hypothetical protein ITG10_09025 [Vibrio sp. ED004]|uniref:hypothetical protein n=1 Tax=Vibrio sp. ED004 TaxID=2785124 RepID=UPI00204C56DE|nr:hypothetical protein [Vibrio sp. ED004]UPR55373.1 hypothetical protein ITG10_09025 [Vibrio sp. ED004]